MILALKLAYKNLIGAGLRTWLNVGVLAFAFILIIFFRSLIDGWHKQAIRASVEWEVGHGHLQHENYDPYDPFSILDGSGTYEENAIKNLTPILIKQASIYPEGRILPILLKGINVNQSTLKIPTGMLDTSSDNLEAIIGQNMADAANLKEGDQILLRWRDKNGTFDAANISIKKIFQTTANAVDNGQIWIPINTMWKMIGNQNEATLFVANKDYQHQEMKGWKFVDQEELLRSFNELIEIEKISSALMYLLLLSIALLAIFDTQVLSVFRRQKEIGTYVSLGMTKYEVMMLFTVEGTMYSVIAVAVGCLIGMPLLFWLSKNGMVLPEMYQDFGFLMPRRLYPDFGIWLFITTSVFVIIAAAFVSFLPARKISRINPVLALKGKLQ